MRLRKQKEVAKENEFYLELLQKALPQEAPPPPPAPSLPPETELIQNGVNHCGPNHQKKSSVSSTTSDKSLIISNGHSNHKLICEYESNKKQVPNGIDRYDLTCAESCPVLTPTRLYRRHELQYMEHQIIKKISSLNDFDDDEVEDIVEHNNAANKTHLKNVTTALTQSKGSNLANLGVTPVTVGQVSQQASNNNKWTHNNTNHTNHINSVNVAANHCPTATNSSNNVSNTNTKGAKTAKNIVANNLSPTKDEHLLR